MKQPLLQVLEVLLTLLSYLTNLIAGMQSVNIRFQDTCAEALSFHSPIRHTAQNLLLAYDIEDQYRNQ